MDGSLIHLFYGIRIIINDKITKKLWRNHQKRIPFRVFCSHQNPPGPTFPQRGANAVSLIRQGALGSSPTTTLQRDRPPR